MKRRLREWGGWVLVVSAAGLVFYAGRLLRPDDLSPAAPSHTDDGLPCAYCEASAIKDHDARIRAYDAALARRKAQAARKGVRSPSGAQP